MNTAANSAITSFIVPATDDQHDRAYRFGKPLTYLSDRQQVRMFILQGRVNAARTASDAQAA